MAENYWFKLIQSAHFDSDITSRLKKRTLSASSSLLALEPYLDSSDLLCVGSRTQLAQTSYRSQHQLILHGKHPLTHLIIRYEHLRLSHAGPTLLTASLSGATKLLVDKESPDLSLKSASPVAGILPDQILKCLGNSRLKGSHQDQCLTELV